MYKKLLLIVAALFFIKLGFAQTNNNADSLIEATITLNDGSILRGKIIAMNLEEISLKTEYAGVIIINQKNISNISNVKNQTKTNAVKPDGNLNEKNVNPSNYQSKYQFRKKPIILSHKYWWNNNYQGLKQGEFYYQNIGILYNGLDFGVIDNFSIGGGAFFLGIVGFFNFHVRSQFKITNGVSIGASYNHFKAGAAWSSSSSENNNSIGLLSGGLTIGDSEKNLTISTGKFTNLVNSNSTSGQSDLAIIIGGNLKLSNNLYLITDNYFADRQTNLNLNCLGFRSINNATAFDYGLMSLSNNNRYDNSPILIPYLALSVKIQ